MSDSEFNPFQQQRQPAAGEVNGGNVQTSVASDQAARQLQDDFSELIRRVNMDLTSQTFQPGDPISVEMAVAIAERSIDYHLASLSDVPELQALAPELKLRFRAGIEAQSTPAQAAPAKSWPPKA